MSKQKQLIFLFVIFYLLKTNDTAAPPNVTINKCCRYGETLEDKRCIVGSTSEKWLPKVYLIKKQTYFTPYGDVPKHFHVKENIKPLTCDNPELIQVDKFSLLSDGSLYIVTHHTAILPMNYCTETQSALICLPKSKKLSKIKKCCSPHSVYNQDNSSCMNIVKDHYLYNKTIINSNDVEFNFGFPDCDSHNYVIAGKYSKEELDESNGNLSLQPGKSLKWSEYCLENTIVNDNDYSVNIFVCSDQFPVQKPIVHNVSIIPS